MMDAIALFLQSHRWQDILAIGVVGLIVLGVFAILIAVAWAVTHATKVDADPVIGGKDTPPVFLRKPQPGDRRYSAFFNSDVELVKYSRDDSYTFKVLEGHRRGLVFKNDSPWSVLPLYAPRIRFRGEVSG